MKNTLYIAIILLLTSCSTENNVDWRLYDEITNVDELTDFFPDLNLDRNNAIEKAEMTKFFDGSKELVYEYELMESDSYDPLFYSITIETTASVREARESFVYTKTAILAGNGFGDLELEEVEIELDGDQNYYAIRSFEGIPNGLIFITRRASNVYSLIISGIYASDHSIITDLIAPEIVSLDRFTLDK